MREALEVKAFFQAGQFFAVARSARGEVLAQCLSVCTPRCQSLRAFVNGFKGNLADQEQFATTYGGGLGRRLRRSLPRWSHHVVGLSSWLLFSGSLSPSEPYEPYSRGSR